MILVKHYPGEKLVSFHFRLVVVPITIMRSLEDTNTVVALRKREQSMMVVNIP